jgi:NAD-dependent deacetylase
MSRARSQSDGGLSREAIDAVGGLLAQAKSALFITGSGLANDAGLATYRGVPGLVRKRDEDGKLFDTALSLDTLTTQPVMTWRYLFDIDATVRAAAPSAGHDVLAQLERALARTTILTVNVDRLHQRAGSKNVIEMHGSLHDLLCKRCELSSRHESFDGLPMPPRCAVCKTVLRPDMPLFGEPLPVDPFTRLQAELDQGFDLVFAIGLGTVTSYLARPVLVAKSEGIPTIEIGTTQSELSEVVDFRFRARPSRALELIWDVYQRCGRISQEKFRAE